MEVVALTAPLALLALAVLDLTLLALAFLVLVLPRVDVSYAGMDHSVGMDVSH